METHVKMLHNCCGTIQRPHPSNTAAHEGPTKDTPSAAATAKPKLLLIEMVWSVEYILFLSQHTAPVA